MKREREIDLIHREGKKLWVELNGLRDAGEKHRMPHRIGKGLDAVGLGLTFTATLRDRVLNAYINANSETQFTNAWRRMVLNEKRIWFEFRMGIMPVTAGTN